MKLYRLPPAGNRVEWADAVEETALRGLFAPWEASFFGSGTAGLAALLMVLRARDPMRDEVVLAAYNCPGMISAAQYAGCTARLVDLAPQRPWMDPAAVARALSPRTLAIIGVDLFGITERYGELRELARANGCFLVQDSAQGFPRRAGDAAWHGDAVVLSFGRGKPVSLLAGGAVLCRDRGLAAALMQVARDAPSHPEPQHVRRVRAYNLLRRPRLYWLPAAVPSLHLGETRFEPLAQVTAMSPLLKRRVAPAVAAYRARSDRMERQYGAMRFGHGITDLARACGVGGKTPLSRYPLLAPDEPARDRFCGALQEVGASPFYGVVLPDVQGLQEVLVTAERFPHARDFAARLFTLPTHDGVRQHDMATMGRLLCETPPLSLRPLRETVG